MGRRKIVAERMLVRFAEGTLAAIDRARVSGESRATLIRIAVLREIETRASPGGTNGKATNGKAKE